MGNQPSPADQIEAVVERTLIGWEGFSRYKPVNTYSICQRGIFCQFPKHPNEPAQTLAVSSLDRKTTNIRHYQLRSSVLYCKSEAIYLIECRRHWHIQSSQKRLTERLTGNSRGRHGVSQAGL